MRAAIGVALAIAGCVPALGSGAAGTWKLGPFTCAMRRAGVACRNGRGRGWFLSRQRYQLYR